MTETDEVSVYLPEARCNAETLNAVLALPFPTTVYIAAPVWLRSPWELGPGNRIVGPVLADQSGKP